MLFNILLFYFQILIKVVFDTNIFSFLRNLQNKMTKYKHFTLGRLAQRNWRDALKSKNNDTYNLICSPRSMIKEKREKSIINWN